MEVQRLVKGLSAALCLVGALGCSSAAPGVTPMEAGVDAGADAGDDIPLFVGPGSLNVTWTINGMSAAKACAAAGPTASSSSSPSAGA